MPGRELRYDVDDIRNRAAAEFRRWHRTLNAGCYLFDVDGVEARRGTDGQLVPVLEWEFTTAQDPANLTSPRYLDLILSRLRDNGQLALLEHRADARQVPFIVIVADYALERFCLIHPKSGRTKCISRSELGAWLESLSIPKAAA